MAFLQGTRTHTYAQQCELWQKKRRKQIIIFESSSVFAHKHILMRRSHVQFQSSLNFLNFLAVQNAHKICLCYALNARHTLCNHQHRKCDYGCFVRVANVRFHYGAHKLPVS